jgi:hypothetical protein
MPGPDNKARLVRGLEIVITLVAGALGLTLSYDFGNRLAGLWLGLIMGLNGGLFGALAASYLTARMFGRKPPADGS